VSVNVGMTNYGIGLLWTSCERLCSTEDAICLYAITHRRNLLKPHYCFDGPVAMKYLLVLVLVVDERGSFSAIDAHIVPCLVQTVLEDVD